MADFTIHATFEDVFDEDLHPQMDGYRLNITDYNECLIRRIVHHHDERWCLYSKDDKFILIRDIGYDSPPQIATSDDMEHLEETLLIGDFVNGILSKDAIEFYTPFAAMLNIDLSKYTQRNNATHKR